MRKRSSRIDPDDAVVLFVDLQAGIVELSKTIALERLNKGVLGTTADSFRNETIVAAVQATKRQTLLIAGVSSEVAVQLPALTAADMGFRVFRVGSGFVIGGYHAPS